MARKSRPTRGPNVRGSKVADNAQRIAAKLVRVKVTANQAFLDLEQAKPKPTAFGPQADRGGSSVRRLKEGSYGVGFQGPRGYGTPTGKVGKQEGNGMGLASIIPRPTLERHPGGHLAGSKRFALDASWAGETLGYDYSAPVTSEPVKARKGKRRWRTVDLNESASPPEACNVPIYKGPKG